MSYGNHEVQFRKRYTEMIFKFYDTFFPGITVHKGGWIKVDEIKAIYENIALTFSDETDENWDILQVLQLAIKNN